MGSGLEGVWNSSSELSRSETCSRGGVDGVVAGWLVSLGSRVLSDGSGMRKNSGDP